ncbi:MAG TPA: XRE family transcriptional regulator [Anaerolineales bacterium]|nr:XRE family transcriptional regulator [Anaerolineales bacterium]
MDDVNSLVAQNLKKIRAEQKLSLDGLAELTGVSKSMLRQIEKGESSPTIATIWKISNGLKISFTSLLSAPHTDTTLVQKTTINPLVEDKGKYRLYPFFPVEEGRRFEVYSIEIEKGGKLSAEAHQAGTQEFLTVYAGELTLRVSEEHYHLAEGDAIRFRADRPHAYINPGKTLAKINLVICYS